MLQLFNPAQTKRLRALAKQNAARNFGLKNAIKHFNIGDFDPEEKKRTLDSLDLYYRDLKQIADKAEEDLNQKIKSQLTARQRKKLNQLLGKPIGLKNRLFELHLVLLNASSLPSAIDLNLEIANLKKLEEKRKQVQERLEKAIEKKNRILKTRR